MFRVKGANGLDGKAEPGTLQGSNGCCKREVFPAPPLPTFLSCEGLLFWRQEKVTDLIHFSHLS